MSSAFHISICGGGIGGLTLASVIAKYSTLPVEIFEAGPTIATIGAGISFYPRTMDIMKELGLYDELIQMAIRPPQENTNLNFRKSDQRDGYHWFTINVTRGQLLVHRKDLVDLLLRRIPDSCKIHTSKKLHYYEVDSKTGKVKLNFTDGSSSITDVLVGADGIHSATRRTMYQNLASSTGNDESRKGLLECVDPVWTGILVYRNMIPIEKFRNTFSDVEIPIELTLYLGKKKHMITFPVSQGRLINVIIYIHNGDAFGTPFEGPWVQDVSEEEIMEMFEDWEACARAVAKCVDKPSRWVLHSLRPLPHYVHHNVALLGDAAHAMEPHFGAGAGQAMEDALVLGRLLTHELTHRGNVANALDIYDQVRLPFANTIVQISRDIGRYYCFGVGHAPKSAGGEGVDLDWIRRSIEDAWKWQSEPTSVWGDAETRWLAMCSARDDL